MTEDLVRANAATAGGNVEMIIAPEKNRVVMRFQRPMLYVEFERDNAAHVGKCLIDTAVSIGAKVVIKAPPVKITKEQRDALVTRALHVYRSMTEKHRPPAIVAQHVVDSILSAIDARQ